MSEKFKYITVLDYESGRVYQYHISEWNMEFTIEFFLEEQGHNSKDCHWMVHENHRIL
jgi:hypothetical protein